MTTITKKQISLALVVSAFAAIMVAGTIAGSASNAFANRHHHHDHHHHHHHFNHFNHHDNSRHSSIHQSISQECNQHQHSTVLTAGANSPVFASGNNLAGCANINGGGNAGANEQ
jgi:Ni/Co efflux regulator RcnB